MPESDVLNMHASCAAIDRRAVLIFGSSGSGKSGLTLRLMAYGGTLVSDDRTVIEMRQGWPVARAPERLRGLIEARGVGILSAQHAAPTRIHLVVDMDQLETERVPPPRTTVLLGQSLPVIHKTESQDFAAAILQYLKAGRADQ